MLEYVFFNQGPCELFVAFLRDKSLDPVINSGGDTLEVALPEDLPDDLVDLIEDEYDRSMAMDQALADAEETDENAFDTAGVVLNLKSGDTVYAKVNPRLLGRVMGVLSPEEFGEIVNAIVDAVENPDSRPPCQQVLAEKDQS